MIKLFDGTFFMGAAFVVAAIVVALMAVTRDSLPIIGTGRGALVAVAVLGIVGCTIGGISQAEPLGWTHPMIILGSLLGIVASPLSRQGCSNGPVCSSPSPDWRRKE